MPQKKPQSQPETTRQQQGGAQPHGGKSRQPQQESPRERSDPREHDQDVQERAPEGDIETGRGGRSPQVDIDRE